MQGHVQWGNGRKVASSSPDEATTLDVPIEAPSAVRHNLTGTWRMSRSRDSLHYGFDLPPTWPATECSIRRYGSRRLFRQPQRDGGRIDVPQCWQPRCAYDNLASMHGVAGAHVCLAPVGALGATSDACKAHAYVLCMYIVQCTSLEACKHTRHPQPRARGMAVEPWAPWQPYSGVER